MAILTRRDALARLAAVGTLGLTRSAASAEPRAVRWFDFPGQGADRFAVHGLHWFEQDQHRLRRFPGTAESPFHQTANTRRVWQLAQAPGGGRIRFGSDTTQIRIRINVPKLIGQSSGMSAYGSHGLDVYINGQYWASKVANRAGERELTFFTGAEPGPKQVEIYLPLRQPIEVRQIGLEAGAKLTPAASFALPAPLVVYGSSISQGIGACRPGMAYGAILTRKLGLDYVNLGFGGSGRAEPVVVDYLKQIKACAFVLDVGLSYGNPEQSGAAYEAMLASLRAAQPEAWLFCTSPIVGPLRNYTSANAYRTGPMVRGIVREAVKKRIDAGDTKIRLVEGDDLIHPEETDAFHEALHPTDLGYSLVADRLGAVVGPLLLGRG